MVKQYRQRLGTMLPTNGSPSVPVWMKQRGTGEPNALVNAPIEQGGGIQLGHSAGHANLPSLLLPGEQPIGQFDVAADSGVGAFNGGMYFVSNS